MFLYFYLFIFVFSSISTPVLTAREGEKCNNSEDWSCMKLRDCSNLKEMRQANKMPALCEWKNGVPIICCPKVFPRTPEQPTTTQETLTSPLTSSSKSSAKPSISSQMCQNYSSYVWEVRESPVLMLGVKPLNVSTCPNRVATLIVGGEPAKLGEFPHMALLGYSTKPGNWQCGGSLISDKFVLTAAHCNNEGKRVKWVRLGELVYNRKYDGADHIDVKVFRSYNHPKYKEDGWYHDIALLELETSVKLNPMIRPLCLVDSRDLHRNAVVTGWGNTRLGFDDDATLRLSRRLMKVAFPLTPMDECVSTYQKSGIKLNPDIHICAGIKGKDSCRGDSGGPLQITVDNPHCMYMVIGIVSFGKGCGQGTPGVFTRVSYYVPWIESIVWPQH